MRIDRAISVYPVRWLSRMIGSFPQRIPILMYHGIRAGVSTRNPYFETNTAPDVFASQMKWLCDKGYSTINLCELLDGVHNSRDLCKIVSITFDDGYHDFYTHAFPVLQHYGFTASVFIISNRTCNAVDATPNCAYMTWDELSEVQKYQITIGSHTLSHPELHRMTAAKIRDEIGTSKKMLEDALGRQIRSFSYPFAFPEHEQKFRQCLRSVLGEYGYENGVSTIIGRAGRGADKFFLPRLPINTYDDPLLFQAKLEGNYDWLHIPQRLYKQLRGTRESRLL